MQAIITKYFGPKIRGSRVKATAYAGSVTVPYDPGLSSEENHNAAAVALCKKMGWTGRLVSGGLPDGRHVYVFLPKYGNDILKVK